MRRCGAFGSRKISEILREYYGKPIHEIGDIELSHVFEDYQCSEDRGEGC